MADLRAESEALDDGGNNLLACNVKAQLDGVDVSPTKDRNHYRLVTEKNFGVRESHAASFVYKATESLWSD